MPDQRIKALLISVSRNPIPVISSINELRPESLCFFVSDEDRAIINNDILPALKERPTWMAEIVTANPHDLLTCYKALSEKWHEIQRNWRLEPGDWTVDYTEGTRPMVAAIVLVTLNDSSGYRYTGGEGEVKTTSQINPWNELAVMKRQEAAALFSRARYAPAVEVFKGLTQRVSGGEKHIYKALAEISEGYRLWDNFQYRAAWERLKPSQKSLEMAMVFSGPPGLKGLAKTLKDNLTFLERLAISTQEVKQEHLLDLLANARRRAELEHRYDDAMVRLYRAIEVHARIKLGVHGIKTIDVKGEQIPTDLRDKFIQRYTDDLDGKIKLPFLAAYRVLHKVNDPASHAFFENWPQMKILLDHLQRSILAYGLETVRPERYAEMFKLTCRICGVEEGSIPGFPSIVL